MPDTSTMAKLLQRFAQMVYAHDRENPTHNTWGIGMAHFDIDRLGLEEGEEILPGIVLQADGGVTGNFRILCDGQHDEGAVEEEEELVEAVASEEIVAPVQSPGPAPRVRGVRALGQRPGPRSACMRSGLSSSSQLRSTVYSLAAMRKYQLQEVRYLDGYRIELIERA
ncbi:MAG: hypothetical protein WBP81_21345 [Solirubrobacteraceae bacterium]